MSLRSLRSFGPLGPLGQDPLAPPALRAATAAVGLILLAALVGATVRLLPWVLDPRISWATLGPFARSLLAVGVEGALMTGWPVGWALATQRLVERGEARVLASLGEPPGRTVLRLAPQGAVLAAALVLSSFAMGREATAPGRVVNALLAEGRASCGEAPSTKGIPFVSVTWLCRGLGAPRLVGRAPIGGVVFTATDAHVSDDLRRIDLTDAKLALPQVSVGVAHLSLKGMAPWARASSLPPLLRAVLVTLSALLAGALAALRILAQDAPARRAGRRVGGIAATGIGAAGPLAALVSLRALELRVPETSPGAWLLLFLLVPVAALFAVLGTAALVTVLPERRSTGSTS